MSLQNIIKRKSKLLLPFSWLYSAGVAAYNKIYDWGLKKSFLPELPVICVGNLAVGGTGKTPMVEYLLRLLSKDFKVATISRGYKRQSTGVIVADENTTTKEIGDEPMQFHAKFPDVKVVVGERRVPALEMLLEKYPETQIVILDDAFQHRAISAGLNILLTDHSNLFTDDYQLPAGELRDLKSNYKKADVIVVTKSPAGLLEDERKKIIEKIKPLSHQTVFFTSIRYEAPYNIFDNTLRPLSAISSVLMVTGIASPVSMAEYLEDKGLKPELYTFPDHHNFTPKDINGIRELFQSIKDSNKIIITTEKDAMRLRQFPDGLKGLPVFALPIRHHFLFNDDMRFEKLIHQFVTKKSNYGKKKQAG